MSNEQMAMVMSPEYLLNYAKEIIMNKDFQDIDELRTLEREVDEIKDIIEKKFSEADVESDALKLC